MILKHTKIRFISTLIKIVFSISFLILVILHYFICEEIPLILLFVFGIIGGMFLGFNLLYFSIKIILTKETKYLKNKN